MADYKHGVYVSEQETSLIVPKTAASGLQVVFGTAPKYTPEPQLVRDFEEAREVLGYSDDWEQFTLCQSMKASFDLVGVGPVVFVNVTPDPEAEGSPAVTADTIVEAIDTRLKEVYPRFGMVPGLILAPGWSTEAKVAAKLQSACENINGVYACECVIDIDTTTATDELAVKAAKDAQGVTSAHAVCCWPCVKCGNEIYAASAYVAAKMAQLDADNGDVPCVSPSNKTAAGITGICLKDGTLLVQDQVAANTVNAAGVVTLLNMNGWRLWGNNTAAYPAGTDPKDRWIMVRRFFTWRCNSLVASYFEKVDEPANYRLIEAICDAENITGNSFVAAGYVAGYHCEFRASENPVNEILNGKIKFHLDLAPFAPAEQIEFVLEFDPSALEAALTGGAA